MTAAERSIARAHEHADLKFSGRWKCGCKVCGEARGADHDDPCTITQPCQGCQAAEAEQDRLFAGPAIGSRLLPGDRVRVKADGLTGEVWYQDICQVIVGLANQGGVRGCQPDELERIWPVTPAGLNRVDRRAFMLGEAAVLLAEAASDGGPYARFAERVAEWLRSYQELAGR